MKKKRICITERIVNLSQLEQLLQKEQMYIALIKKELQNQPLSIETVNSAINELENVHQKAIDFEFCLEHRKCRI